MKNNLYVLYNTLSCRYGDVMAYPSDAFCVARMVDAEGKGFVTRSETEICRVGSIDVETGVVDTINPVRLAWPEHVDSLPTNNVD